MCLSKCFFAAVGVTLLAWPVDANAARRNNKSSVSIHVLVDNSAALVGAEAEAFKRRMFLHLTDLRKKRRFKHASIKIVSTNNPRNLMVGSPVDLFRNGASLLSKIAVVEKGCADLVGALEQIKLNMELSPATETYAFIFWAGIHTGTPCDNVSIKLPQATPDDMDLSFLAKDSITVRFFWTHNLQVRPWLDAVRGAGLKNVKVFDEETSKAVLNTGLGHE